jgi:hypothetical protein
MACCGQRRANFRPGRPFSGSATQLENSPAMVTFEYTGPTGMTVVGPISGLKYRFGSPGARVQVNWRDAASMARVLNLLRLE